MFIAWIRHIAWMSYRIAAGEDSGEWTSERVEMDLDGVRYLKRNRGSTAKANHENWMRKKKELGWKWGAVKDEGAKIHPGLKPYDELPKIEALKNVACFFAHQEAEDLWRALQK